MQISEPVTTITDYLLGAAGSYFAVLLFRIIGPRNRVSGRLWSIGFMVGAFAAFAGGTYHGFALQLGDSIRRPLWNVVIYSIGASAGFMVSRVLASSVRRNVESARWLIIGVLVTLAGFVVQQSGIQPLPKFNHNDIYHVMQTGALFLFFKGARLLEDR